MRSGVVAAACVGLVVVGGCGAHRGPHARQTRETAAVHREPAARPGQSAGGSAPVTSEVRSIRITHGVANTTDAVRLDVTRGLDPGSGFVAVFGGTRGGLEPATSGSETFLEEGWVYISGSFPMVRGIIRVPIVVTNTIGVGADGTRFMVVKDTAAPDSPQRVLCIAGKVSVRSRLETNPQPLEVGEGKYVDITIQNYVVHYSECKDIPTLPDDPIAQLVAKAEAAAGPEPIPDE
jgi:hypothetical protein